MKRRIKDALKRLLFRFYKLGSRFGVHILPAHYYAAPRRCTRSVGTTRRNRSGTSLLRAYLTHNEQLKEIFPEYDPAPDIDGLNPESIRPFDQPRRHFPASISIETR